MKRSLFRTLWSVLVVATLHVVALPRPGVTATVDPAVVGTWEIMVPNPQGAARWIWEIRADGTYSFRSEGPGSAPPHSGSVTFVNGQWSLQTTTGLPGWTDTGTYQFPNPDTLAATGKLGLGLWQRSKTTGGPPSAATWPQSVVAMAPLPMEAHDGQLKIMPANAEASEGTYRLLNSDAFEMNDASMTAQWTRCATRNPF